MLQTTDVPERYQRKILRTNVSYPTNSRYTLQWIVTPGDEFALNLFPNNNDATFMNQRLPKPADLLLHYNYGTAAVKQWGKNTSILTNRPDIPRPLVPALTSMEPTRDKHDHSKSIQKRAAATGQGGEGSGSKGKRKRTEGAAGDLEEQDRWDEDDVMLFFWGNSKAAMDRHAQKKQERTKHLEDWRAGVTGNPDIV
jgi:hypothetical protein